MSQSPNRNMVKCVLVGSTRTGKTCLLTAYVNNKFPTEYVPTVFEQYSTDTMVDGEHCHLDISDTSGMDEYDKLRPIDYFGTNVFLVCFCVVSPASFYDVRNKWVPEVTTNCKNTPFLLVGTQTDLRDDTKTTRKLAKRELQPITYEQGQHLANELGAFKYVECSALTQKGLQNVFTEALRVVIGTSKDKCLLM